MSRVHAPHDANLAGQAAPRKGWVRAWVEFWFTPTDPVGLHAVRFLSGLLFLAWLLAFAGHHEAFFGLGGWFDRQAYIEGNRLPDDTPAPISWSLVYLVQDANPALLAALYWSSVVVLTLFTLGVAPQVTGILTWVIVASYTANPAISYDGDALLIVLAFYLMIGCALYGIPRRREPWSVLLLVPPASWFLRRRDAAPAAVPSVAANLTLRLLQVHFALIICVSGFHKLQYAEWWTGSNLWYALHPAFETTLEQAQRYTLFRREYLSVVSLGTYLALAWQIGYPVFAWRPRWRIVLVGGALVGWLCTAFVYRLPLFGPAYLIGSLCFLTAAEWHGLLGRLLRAPGVCQLATWFSAGEGTAREPHARRKEAVSATAARAR